MQCSMCGARNATGSYCSACGSALSVTTHKSKPTRMWRYVLAALILFLLTIIEVIAASTLMTPATPDMMQLDAAQGPFRVATTLGYLCWLTASMLFASGLIVLFRRSRRWYVITLTVGLAAEVSMNIYAIANNFTPAFLPAAPFFVLWYILIVALTWPFLRRSDAIVKAEIAVPGQPELALGDPAALESQTPAAPHLAGNSPLSAWYQRFGIRVAAVLLIFSGAIAAFFGAVATISKFTIDVEAGVLLVYASIAVLQAGILMFRSVRRTTLLFYALDAVLALIVMTTAHNVFAPDATEQFDFPSPAYAIVLFAVSTVLSWPRLASLVPKSTTDMIILLRESIRSRNAWLLVALVVVTVSTKRGFDHYIQGLINSGGN